MRQVLFGAGNYHLVAENFEPLPVSDRRLPIAAIARSTLNTLGTSPREQSVLWVAQQVANPQNDELEETLVTIGFHTCVSQKKKPRGRIMFLMWATWNVVWGFKIQFNFILLKTSFIYLFEKARAWKGKEQRARENLGQTPH